MDSTHTNSYRAYLAALAAGQTQTAALAQASAAEDLASIQGWTLLAGSTYQETATLEPLTLMAISCWP